MLASISMATNGTNAVKKLRREKLNRGLPYMINSSELPVEQCYLEYPTGIIKLVELSKTTRNFNTIRNFLK